MGVVWGVSVRVGVEVEVEGVLERGGGRGRVKNERGEGGIGNGWGRGVTRETRGQGAHTSCLCACRLRIQ